MATNISSQSAQLIRRTAWLNMHVIQRGPTKEDEKYIPIAIRMLTMVAGLNYAFLDLETALLEKGLMRHHVKRRFSQAQQLAMAAHGTAYEMLRSINLTAAREYNDKMEQAYNSVIECVLLYEPEKSYNIVLSLCRLIEKYNGPLSGRYDFYPAKPLYRIPVLLECMNITDHGIDELIELNFI